uniref:Precorrin-2 dehydrogenase n=1 Tax=Aureoumbra lagunensis TaxID=44058 RepID=A0A7S3JUR7_9STRA|mmetsp:Transcript_7802/g.11819  ORF Transcript_7802/g.11819 Transcript_7802/m.11819 type:complete len:329 (-) Transcript_7802:107-1093(-)
MNRAFFIATFWWCIQTVSGLAAIAPNSKVLVVGSGPISVLASKTAALKGYTTLLVTSTPDLARELLWLDGPLEDAKEDLPKNPLLLDPSQDEDVATFEKEAINCQGVIVAYDADRVLSDSLLELILPTKKQTKVQRVTLMSRHLNGKANGPLSAAAKVAANKDVFAFNKQIEQQYRDYEKRVKERCVQVSADLVIIRAGTLKGGGPGSIEISQSRDSTQTPTLTRAYYAKVIQKDLVNWQLLFDCDTQGVVLTPGDTAQGPGFRAVFTSTSPNAEPGDSGRVGVAQALVRSLALPNAGGAEFGVNTASARQPPSEDDWAAQFANVLPS